MRQPGTPASRPSGGLGEFIGPYQLVEKQMQARDIVEYLARKQDAPDAFFSVKVASRGAFDERGAEALHAEARVMQRFSHPNIPAFCDFFRDNDRVVLVLQSLGNLSLEQFVRDCENARLPINEQVVWHVALALFDALAHAHNVPETADAPGVLLHRNITPSVVMLGQDGRVILTGFSSTQGVDINEDITACGVVIRTPSYLSPEQVRGHEVTEGSDAYAAALIVWELLTGKSATPKAASDYDLLLRLSDRRVEPLRKLRPDIPALVATALDLCLNPDPDQRRIPCEEVAGCIRAGIELADGAQALRDAITQLATMPPQPAQQPATAVPLSDLPSPIPSSSLSSPSSPQSKRIQRPTFKRPEADSLTVAYDASALQARSSKPFNQPSPQTAPQRVSRSEPQPPTPSPHGKSREIPADYPRVEPLKDGNSSRGVALDELDNLQLLRIDGELDDDDVQTVAVDVGDSASSDLASESVSSEFLSSADDSSDADEDEPVLPLRREAMISSPPVLSTATAVSLGGATPGAFGVVGSSVGGPTDAPVVPSDVIDISAVLESIAPPSGGAPDVVHDAVHDALAAGPIAGVVEVASSEIAPRLEPVFPRVEPQGFAVDSKVAPLVSSGMHVGMATAQLELDDWERVRLQQQRKRKAITFFIVFVVVVAICALLVYALIQSQHAESSLALDPVAVAPTDTTRLQQEQGEKGSQGTVANEIASNYESNNHTTTASSDAGSRDSDVETGFHHGASSDASLVIGAKETLVTVTGPPNGVVYVGGRPVGRTSIAFTMACGHKFLRVGQPSTTAGVTQVKWLAPGRMVDFPCGKDVIVLASQTPDRSSLFSPLKPPPNPSP